MTCLLELLQLCTGASIVPQLFVVGEHLNQSAGERRKRLPLIRVQAVDLLPDQGVHREQESEPAVFMAPFFEFGKVSQRTCRVAEVANVEVLETDQERMHAAYQ